MTSTPGPGSVPLVSVLMPTFRHAAFIERALLSLLGQVQRDWELVVVDDGSPDATAEVVARHLHDERIRYVRLERNVGLGAALNVATEAARGRYLAYLPSDDVYYPEHLERLVDVLETDPGCYLAYGGVRWGHNRTGFKHSGPTLQGEAAVGSEAEALRSLPQAGFTSIANLLALVQVVHRRDWEHETRWPTRTERESDGLEADQWRALCDRGASFRYTGSVTCEWVEHPDQRHKIIGHFRQDPVLYTSSFSGRGLAGYRSYYGVGRDELLEWKPTAGVQVSERTRYQGLLERRSLPAQGGLKILLVGDLGFNPERIVAFEERGHKLYGLWITQPETWDTVGPLPFGNVEDVAPGPGWRQRVEAIGPDVIYALLNWPALGLIDEVVAADLGVPIVFHFKESPDFAEWYGLWPRLNRILSACDARVFINRHVREWFALATGAFDSDTSLVLDGDLPKADWLGDEWAEKLSARRPGIHTVCAGRPYGLERLDFDTLVAAGIHLHFYGEQFHLWSEEWVRDVLPTGHLHLHPMVEPRHWVSELSQYDAGWLHVFDSDNGHDVRRANWNDLNVPARLSSYAFAGLPWIIRDNRHSLVAVAEQAEELDVGVFFETALDLASQLREPAWLQELERNMRARRGEFAFDTHVDELVELFRKVIASKGR
jgi:Glycosyl transferase family 2